MRITVGRSGESRMKIFETLLIIGRALRYHNEHCTAEAPHGSPAGTGGCGAV
ncbi:MAG: hypothetical protein VB140_07415 [Burkholderia sp.]